MLKRFKLLLLIGSFLAVYLIFFRNADLNLSAHEKELITKAGVPAETALSIKKDAYNIVYINTPHASIRPLEGIDENGNTKAVNAVAYTVMHNKTEAIIKKYSPVLKKNGLLIFVSDQNFGSKPDEIAVMKTSDQYDILRAMGTDGINYGITNPMLINKLKEWEKICSFEITGAGRDWLEARFIKQPADMKSFAKQVYKFCPDVVEQGTQTLEALANEMTVRNTLYLWWD